MTSDLSNSHLARPWPRLFAMLCAGLVLMLSLASTSPMLHAWLHGESGEVPASSQACASALETSPDHADHATSPDSTDEAHDCAITLFSHGVALVDAFSALPDCPVPTPDNVIAHRNRTRPPEARHLRPQPQAPPVA